MNRREFLGFTGAAAVFVAGPALAIDGHFITPAEANDMARDGEILLIDIRTAPEWARSGVGKNANTIAMQDRQFLAKLDALTKGNKSAKVALICATGRRSDRTRSRLISHGYTNVLDVSEGMIGSTKGPGWIRRGLPIRTYSE